LKAVNPTFILLFNYFQYHDEVHQHQVMQTTTSLRRYSAATRQRGLSMAEKSLTTHDVRIGNGRNGFRGIAIT